MEKGKTDYLSIVLTNAAKVNWLKGVVVMEITDEALRPFVKTEITKFHNEIKDNFGISALCGTCSLKNATKCPTGICSVIMSLIVSEHRFGRPSYMNSDINKWLSDPWEIAKCYMSISKDVKGKTESDLDFPSILSVVINNKRFERLTGVDMTDDSNVFCKGRNARNDTMHSREHKMKDTDLKDYCDIFIEIIKLTVADSKQYVKKIEEVRDNPLSITTEEIVKLKEMAANLKEMTAEMKKEMGDEATQLVKYIRGEAEKVSLTNSMMANFVEGCKESLYQFTLDVIRQQKPDYINEEEWTIETFVQGVRMFPQMNSLSQWHIAILFRKTHTEEDMRKWDLFLFCFILQLELLVPVNNNVLRYVKVVIEVRNELLHNGVARNELSKLCGYLDEPLKSTILGILIKKYALSETIQASVTLTSWCGDERDFNNALRYLKKDEKEDQEKNSRITFLENKVDSLNKKIARLYSAVGISEEEPIDGGVAGEKAVSFEAVVEIEPKKVSSSEKKTVEVMMTSKKKNNNILNNRELDDLNETLGSTNTEFNHGSILLKVEFPSVEKLVIFWKGCTDGTVVKAMSKIRDAYRKHLGNGELEFDIVLKKREVTQRRNQIVEDMEAQMKQLHEKVTAANDFLSRQDDVLRTWTDDIVDRSDQESSDDLKPPSQPPLTDEKTVSYGPKNILDDLKSPSQLPLTDETAESFVPKILDDLKPPSQSLLTDETAESYGPKILDDLKPPSQPPLTDEKTVSYGPKNILDDLKSPSQSPLTDETAESYVPKILDDLKPPSQSLLTDETAESYGPKILDDLKSPSQSPLTYETAESYVPKILDDLKPQSQSLLTDETAESYGPKILDAAKPKVKQQDMPSTLGSPMKSVRYGEDEADRLVKFLRQISESLSGGIKSTVKTHIRDIVNNAKENRKTEFDKSIDDFMNDAMFKGGISVNLIKQAIRGFDMIKENPQFGELVTSRLDAIKKEISEQKMPPFEKGDDKTGVSIAEEIEVEESERPRSKTHGETILKHSEKDEKSSSIGRGFEDSMLTNPSSSSKLTSKGTDDSVKKSFNLLEPSHESSAKVTE